MKAAVYHSPGDLALEERDVYDIADDELLVRVRASSICGTDLKIFKNGHFKIPSGTSRVLGHELAGEIVKTGKLLSGYRNGGRVSIVPNVGCGHCEYCRDGYNNMCPSYEAFGISIDGGFQDYVRVPGAAIRGGNVFEIPDSLSFAEAALVEPLSCCYNAYKELDIGPHSSVLVIGPGPIGACFVMLSRMAGARQVIVAGRNDQRLKAIEPFGADHTINTTKTDIVAEIARLTGGRGVDVVVTAASSPELQPLAIELLAINGRVNLFGGLPKGTKVALDTNLIHYRGLKVYGSTGSSVRDYFKSLQLAASGQIRLKDLISETMDLKDIGAAFDYARSGTGMKVVLAA
jgi:L-iditol 2-dehydrogenase